MTCLQILFSLLPGKMGFVMRCGWKFNTFNYALNRDRKDKSWFCLHSKPVVQIKLVTMNKSVTGGDLDGPESLETHAIYIVHAAVRFIKAVSQLVVLSRGNEISTDCRKQCLRPRPCAISNPTPPLTTSRCVLGMQRVILKTLEICIAHCQA